MTKVESEVEFIVLAHPRDVHAQLLAAYQSEEVLCLLFISKPFNRPQRLDMAPGVNLVVATNGKSAEQTNSINRLVLE